LLEARHREFTFGDDVRGIRLPYEALDLNPQYRGEGGDARGGRGI